MSDIGEIKARVTIEYDGAGIDEAKKDLSSLSDIVGGGGGLTENVGTANEALASLDEQMGKNAGSASDLVSSVGALEKPMQASADAVSSVNEVLGEQQAAVEDAGTAFESMKKPVEETTALMQSAASPMEAVTKNAQAMQAPLDNVNTGFVQMSENLSNAVPLMPQVATGMHSVAEEFDPKAFGLDTFNQNWDVFQNAMSDPAPFAMIQQHLSDTGQTWSDFFSSVGSDGNTFAQQVLDNAKVSQESLGTMSSSVESMMPTISPDAWVQINAMNKQYNDVAASIGEVGQAGGVGTVLLGPEDSWSKLNAGLTSTEEGIGKIGAAAGASGGFSFGGLVQGFDSFMRPLMYAQMAGMMIGAVSSGIYNMAALAEGPAAHSIGSFTGAIDVMGQHAQQTGEQFSEGLGQGIQPMIDAMNNVAGNSKVTNFWSAVGGGIGNVGSLLGSLGQVAGGGIQYLAQLAYTPSLQSITSGNSTLQTGWEGLQNLWAQITGGAEPYPTTGTGMSQAAQIQASLNTTITAMYAQANDPQYLAAQAYASSQAGYATLGQTRYDVSHTSGMSPFDYAPQAYQNSMMGAALANGGSGYGISGVDLNRAFFTNMLNQLPPEFTGGCFVAGTPVLLADGTERAIETLQINDQVLARDGEKQVVATVRDRIVFLTKQTYELLFSDGNALTTTDSHPIMTDQGWKSLSPASTKKENPDLAVLPLQIGDCIHTVNGTCALVAIETREIVQVYNVTVDGPHTYYASGVLVHNAKLSVGSQVQQNVANSTVPDMDMKNTNLMQSMMGNFTSADLSHTFTATVNWAASGDLNHTFQAAASWIGQGLTNAFTGVASWLGNNLLNTFTGDASWLGNNLLNTFTGDASWIGQGLTNVFEGVASWVSSGGLQHTFEGVADWIGQNLEHTFQGVASWVASGLSQTANVPGFAAGVQNFGGGLAVVGENGPELVHLKPGTSVYPQSSIGDFLSLNMLQNNAPSSSGDLHIHVQVGSKEVAHEIIPQIAPILRSTMGVRR